MFDFMLGWMTKSVFDSPMPLDQPHDRFVSSDELNAGWMSGMVEPVTDEDVVELLSGMIEDQE